MPARPVLMQARLEHQSIARSGAIHHGLGIVAGLDRMLGGGEQRCESEQQEERAHE
jgi:hypothetical protein